MIILLVVTRFSEKTTLVRMQKQTNLALKCDHNKQFTHPSPPITTSPSNRIVKLSFLYSSQTHLLPLNLCYTSMFALTHSHKNHIHNLPFFALFPKKNAYSS